MDVTRNEEIQFAVAVIVAKGSPCRPSIHGDTRFFSHISESSIAVVVVKAVFSVVGYKDVRPPIVIVVADGHSKAPTVVGHPSRGGHIGKGTIVVIVKERGMWRLFFAVQRFEG